MSFFTPRERAGLGKSAEIRGRGRARELVRHDFTPRARPRPAEPHISGHVGTLVNRVAANSVQEIDDLIFRLQQRREQLISESARVQREVAEYAALTQSTVQSTRVIGESLARFNKVPDVARTSDAEAQDVAAAEERNGAGEPAAQQVEDAIAADDKAEAVSDAGERRAETSEPSDV